MWARGHVLELKEPSDYDPKWAEWREEGLPIIPPRWELRVSDKCGSLVRSLVAALRQASEIVIATDPGREGEHIAWNIIDYANVGQNKPVWRLWSKSQTPVALREALGKLEPAMQRRPDAEAARVRQRSDWLEGLNFTRLLTIRCRPAGSQGVVSVGRVQTPTLGLVVRRERERRGFVAEQRFALEAKCTTANGHSLKLTHSPDPPISKRAGIEELARRAANAQAPLKVSTDAGKRKKPPAPLELVSLQALMNRLYHWPVAKTLDIAQSLYEKRKALSYPRTDCKAYDPTEWGLAEEICESLADLSEAYAAIIPEPEARLCRPNVYNAKAIEDTDHTALRPTEGPFDDRDWSDDEKRCFDAVARRYIAQLMPDWHYEETRVELNANQVPFRARGIKTIDPGWRRALASEKDEKDEENEAGIIPPIRNGEQGGIAIPQVKESWTKPRPRYTEGSLGEMMHKVGVGTKATQAGIVETLKNRKYMVIQEKIQLAPTSMGEALFGLVEKHAPGLAETATTAELEQILEQVAAGKVHPREAFTEIKTRSIKTLMAMKKEELPTLPFPQAPPKSRTTRRRRPQKKH